VRRHSPVTEVEMPANSAMPTGHAVAADARELRCEGHFVTWWNGAWRNRTADLLGAIQALSHLS
jgi:hypothetical protein